MKAAIALRTLAACAGVGVILVVQRSLRVTPTHVFHFAPWYLHMCALGLSCVDVLARAGRSCGLATASGTRLRLRVAVRAILAGDAAGALTPARSGSDPAKLLLWRTDGVRTGPGAAVLLGEITAEAASIVLVGAVLVIGWKAPLVAIGAALLYAGWVTLTTSVATTMALAIARGKRSGITTWLMQRAPRIRRVAMGYLAAARRLLRLPARALLPALALSLLHIVARLAVLPLLASIWGVADRGALLAWPLVLMYGSTLVPLPSGGGSVEIGFMLLLRGALPAAQLALLLFWWRFYTYYLITLIGGLVLLDHGYRSTRESLAQTHAAPLGRSGSRARGLSMGG